MTSWQAQVLGKVLRVVGDKKMLSSVELTREHIEGLSLRPASYGPPKSLNKTQAAGADERCSWTAITSSPIRAKTIVSRSTVVVSSLPTDVTVRTL